MRAAFAATLLSLAAIPAAGEIVLGLPIDCRPGDTCHIQHLVDRDPGAGVQDYACGRLSYDGHKGTDFALPSLAAMDRGVDVLAAAPGVVTATRDGMADEAYSAANAARVEGRDCGNGVVIRHSGGWETQYCHLKQGTIKVAKGARVEAGSVLGQVGLSGRTQFPHLHLSVRHDGAVIDPFDPTEPVACANDTGTLWHQPPEAPPGGLIHAGFSATVPSYQSVKEGTATRTVLPSDASGLVLFAYAYGGLSGDELLFHITGPQGSILIQRTVLEKDQAQFFRASGKRLKTSHWPPGTYHGTVSYLRGSTNLGQVTAQVDIH